MGRGRRQCRGHSGTLVGNPQWQPAGGKKAGALQFDGINDYISTDSVLNPADGPFSVFAWIQGGAPGQVIVSQATGADWLMASSPGGALMSDLRLPGRHGQSLTSSVVITDGAWHGVGFVWDGANRILYVDDIEVARDTQATLAGTYAGLHVGAGKYTRPRHVLVRPDRRRVHLQPGREAVVNHSPCTAGHLKESKSKRLAAEESCQPFLFYEAGDSYCIAGN